MTEQRLDELNKSCQRMRANLIEMTHGAGNIGAHIGGALSLVEIMAVLYLDFLNIDVDNLQDEERDRLILSKGHGVMAQYAAMVEAGILRQEDLASFKKDGSALSSHPSMNAQIGIEFSSGSLGQGLSLGVGTALALRRKGKETSKVVVVVGDGECDEGQIWEAAMSAAHFGLSNLYCIVDRNHLQYDGPTEEVKKKSNLNAIWTAFGWHVVECEGHDVACVRAALSEGKHDGLVAILADTVKGKGVSFMEGNPSWHNNRLAGEQYEQAKTEVRRNREV